MKNKNATVRGYRGRGTSSAELRSTGPKLRPEEGSDESSALDGESIRRDVPADDKDRREYLKFLKKFFKGE